jgi:molecular chaperone DnaK (HSP70)
MSSCTSCSAPRTADGGLFCAFCGKSADLPSGTPRLLEAISIETMGDEASPVIRYGAYLPSSYSDVFSTGADAQETIQIHLLLGNARRASENRTLANLVLPIVARGPRGGPRVQLTVTVDRTGRLTLRMEEPGRANVFERNDLFVPVSRPSLE